MLKVRQVISKKLHRVSFRGDYYMFMQYYILQIEKKITNPPTQQIQVCSYPQADFLRYLLFL